MEKINDDILYEQFLQTMRIQDKTQKTVENYGSCIKDFMIFLHGNGHVFVDVQGKIGKRLLVEYLEYLKGKKVNGNNKTLSYARIKIYFSALNCFYNYLFIVEELVETNIVLPIRQFYLKSYKNGYKPQTRKAISVEDMSRFLKGIFNLQDKAVAVTFVKTGVRKGELMAMDVDDIDFEMRVITVKERFKKRTNCEVIFDDECARVLNLWLQRREKLVKPGEKALFLNEYGHRIHKNKAYNAITYWATRYGFHNPISTKLKDHFGPHNLRHCFTTYLSEAKMYEPFIEWLRGDSEGKAIGRYKHLTTEKVRDAYDKAMPIFGL